MYGINRPFLGLLGTGRNRPGTIPWPPKRCKTSIIWMGFTRLELYWGFPFMSIKKLNPPKPFIPRKEMGSRIEKKTILIGKKRVAMTVLLTTGITRKIAAAHRRTRKAAASLSKGASSRVQPDGRSSPSSGFWGGSRALRSVEGAATAGRSS